MPMDSGVPQMQHWSSDGARNTTQAEAHLLMRILLLPASLLLTRTVGAAHSQGPVGACVALAAAGRSTQWAGSRQGRPQAAAHSKPPSPSRVSASGGMLLCGSCSQAGGGAQGGVKVKRHCATYGCNNNERCFSLAGCVSAT